MKKTRNLAIVASKFNEYITRRLLNGCLKELERNGIPKKEVKIIWVPGAFEIPTAALKLAKKKAIDAVICLGAVIRGETYHFELVAQGAARGISQVSLMTGKPVILGVLSTDTVNQALARSEEDGDNKGCDAASAALQMVDMLKQI